MELLKERNGEKLEEIAGEMNKRRRAYFENLFRKYILFLNDFMFD